MKLIRFGEKGKEKPGVLLGDGRQVDLSKHFPDWNSTFFQDGGLGALKAVLDKHGASLPQVPKDVRLGACIARPYKIIGIGLNYSDHAKETGAAVPKEPIMFMKATNSHSGPNDNIIIPRNSQKTDWEVELGVVIGREARYLSSPEEAERYIAGYCISNDVSEREFQLERGGQWDKGKSCESFNPLGPWLVTSDEIGDVDDLEMKLTVNGQPRQKGNTKTMIFDVNFIVHYLSQFMVLEAGDVITTGTPPGVGMGMKPPVYLKAGDVVELTIEKLGQQKQTCVAAQ